MPHGTLIVWFRRDLRLDDQAALYHATQDAARIVPLFILDPALLTPPHVGAPRLHFLLESLHVLDVGLRRRGSYLLLRQGDPLEVLQHVLRESDASGVYFNRDYVWPGRQRDAHVEQALRAAGFDVHTFADQVLVEPDELLTAAGMPYSVYTPYRRAWLRQAARPPRPSPPERLHTPVLETLPIPTIDSYGLRVDHTLPRAGEDAGLALLARFTEPDDAPIFRYKHDRNAPALDATSHLSPHLRHGTVGVRTVLHAAHRALERCAAVDSGGVDVWIGELAWRDFYQQWVWHAPRVLEHAFDASLDDLEFENDPEHLAAWCEGRTGFPIVDAAMRQLNGIGWMHNRLRMIVASFLCKDLLIDWRLGERYFWENLVDGDKPANVGGWQWSASVGIDAQPYFRVFNPTLQSQRFDPDGTFIRHWVPELAKLPNSSIHAPETVPPMEALSLGFKLGRDYPYPIVDHKMQRLRVLALYKRFKGRPDSG